MAAGAYFQGSTSTWVRYSDYEFRQINTGTTFVSPSVNAIPEVYDPLLDVDAMVTAAINAGMLCINRESDEKIRKAVSDFVARYGLVGLISAKQAEPRPSDNISFFPFDNHIPDAVVLPSIHEGTPETVKLGFSRNYAERYDWLVKFFRELAYSFCSYLLYYGEYGEIDSDARAMCARGVNGIFGEATIPQCHIELKEKPILVWDFCSLSQALCMALGLMMADESQPLRACRFCGKIFLAGHPLAAFCDPKCKNKYNVYKSRDKKAGKE